MKAIEELKKGLEVSKKYDDNPNKPSWDYQEGVLLSQNEASQILQAYETMRDALERIENYESPGHSLAVIARETLKEIDNEFS
jgi:hypothetical protein